MDNISGIKEKIFNISKALLEEGYRGLITYNDDSQKGDLIFRTVKHEDIDIKKLESTLLKKYTSIKHLTFYPKPCDLWVEKVFKIKSGDLNKKIIIDNFNIPIKLDFEGKRE